MSLPAGSYQPALISYLDAGNEIGTMRFYATDITAANHDAQVALWATLLSATDAITLGERVRDVYDDESLYSVAQPTNGAARETKLLVQYADDTNGQRMTCTVPTLDPTIPTYVINVNAKDVVVLDDPASIAAFIAAFEAFAVNPRTGNGVTVTGLQVVGRAT